MPTTPLGIPYPSLTDAPNGPAQMQGLASTTDTLLNQLFSREKGQVIAFGGIGNVNSSGTTEVLSATTVALSGLTIAYNYIVHVHGTLSSSGTALVAGLNVRAAAGSVTTSSAAIPAGLSVNPVTTSQTPFSIDLVWEPTATAMNLGFGVVSNNTQNCQLAGGYYIVTIG